MSDLIKIKNEMFVRPFMVPNFIVCDIGDPGGAFTSLHDKVNTSLPLKSFSEEALIHMCERFRQDVMVKAGFGVV